MKRVLIQLPDGLKPKFMDFCEEYRKKGYEVLLWAGSNFGSCDIPNLPEELEDILIVNIGHNEFPPKV